MKPIIIKRSGSKWELYLSVPMAVLYGARPSKTLRADFEAHPNEALVLSKTPKGLALVANGKPAKFTKQNAMSHAHMIGRYFLGFGDFVDSYTSVAG